MAGIQDIGNGLGLLYVLDLNGTIIGTVTNDVHGVRQIRQIGAACAPISTDRPAVGTITFTATPAGNITAVTVNGVSQISLAVAATAGDTAATAASVANAINAFTPGSGPNFTAQAIGSVVNMFSPAGDGTTVNGQTITVAVSNIAITSTTTDFTNGADGSGAEDSVVGLKFYLNADYTSPVPTNSVASAIEITEYMVVRGMQSGIPILPVTIAGDLVATLPRYSCIQQLTVSTQGAAPTDYLGYINPSAFSVGDRIRLVSSSLGQVAIVIDETDTASPLTQRNIRLTNATPFSLTNYQAINLVLTADVSAGLVWTEDTRSFSSGPEAILRADMLTILTNSAGVPGKEYIITDIAQAGFIVKVATANRLELGGTYLALVPDFQNTSGNFYSSWTPFLAAPVLGKQYNYNQMMYENLTGVSNTTPPNIATALWALVPFSSGEYISEVQYAEYDIVNNWFSFRRDRRGNRVIQDFENQYGFSIRPDQCMCWGNDECSDNIMDNSVFQMQNTFCPTYSNTFKGGVVGTGLYIGGGLTGNLLDGPSVLTDLYLGGFVQNMFLGVAEISSLGNASAASAIVSENRLLGNTVVIAGDTSDVISISGNTFLGGSTIITCVAVAGITNSTFFGGEDTPTTLLLAADVGADMGVANCVFEMSSGVELVGMGVDSQVFKCKFKAYNLVNVYASGCEIRNIDFNFNNQFLGGLADPVTVDMIDRIYDVLPAATYIASNVLTMPDKYAGSGGTFQITSANPTEMIDEIQNLLFVGGTNDQKMLVNFFAAPSLTVTFTGTAISGATDGAYISDQATDVIVGNTEPFADVLSLYSESMSGSTPAVARKYSINKVI